MAKTRTAAEIIQDGKEAVAEARLKAEILLRRLHHYVIPNEALPTPYWDVDLNIVSAALLAAERDGIKSVLDRLNSL